MSATAVGNLTLHGVTRSVLMSLQAQRQGGIIAVSGSLPIVFADYGFMGPSVLGFVTVNDQGSSNSIFCSLTSRPVLAPGNAASGVVIAVAKSS